MPGDILCEACADRYSKLLRTQLDKTGELNAQVSRLTNLTPDVATSVEENPGTVHPSAETLLEPMEKIQEPEQETKQVSSQSKALRAQRPPTTLVGFFLLGVGMVALVAAVVFASTISAFIGLGLAFWGMLAFFIQPTKYVKSDLMNATAISSLRTVENMMQVMGYGEKGVYIGAGDSDKVVVFVPTEPFSMIPEVSEIEGKTFLSNPKGLLVPPPGLALAALIENKLGFKVKNCGLQTLVEALPKVLVEDLEIVKDVEIELTKDTVRFKLYDSIYTDFCSEVRETTRRCGLGCPMCSALASILTLATGKPVLSEEDKVSDDRRITETVYKLISGRRL
jgi:uncharacterized membrane protein